jgi:hypothetical protein
MLRQTDVQVEGSRQRKQLVLLRREQGGHQQDSEAASREHSEQGEVREGEDRGGQHIICPSSEVECRSVEV